MQSLAIPPLEIGGTLVVHLKRKTPSDACQTRFSRDSYRTYTLKSFAISIKYITFAYQLVMSLSSHIIATWF